MFEVAGVREDIAKEALRLAAYKLPIQTRLVAKETLADIAAALPGSGAAGEGEAEGDAS
jgi:large subunit ribosomal protein L16